MRMHTQALHTHALYMRMHTWTCIHMLGFQKLWNISFLYHCYWFCSVPVGTAGIFRTVMQTGTIIPSIPPWVKFQPISGYSGHSSQFWSISAKIQISANTSFWLKKKKKAYRLLLLLLLFLGYGPFFFLFFFFFFLFLLGFRPSFFFFFSSSFSSSSSGFQSLLLLFFSFLFFLLMCFSSAASYQSAFPFLFVSCTCNVCYYLSAFPLNAMSFVLNFLFV